MDSTYLFEEDKLNVLATSYPSYLYLYIYTHTHTHTHRCTHTLCLFVERPVCNTNSNVLSRALNSRVGRFWRLAGSKWQQDGVIKQKSHFKIMFGNSDKFLTWGSEGAWHSICAGWSWKVRRECYHRQNLAPCTHSGILQAADLVH